MEVMRRRRCSCTRFRSKVARHRCAIVVGSMDCTFLVSMTRCTEQLLCRGLVVRVVGALVNQRGLVIKNRDSPPTCEMVGLQP
jgi:hypothetical protein